MKIALSYYFSDNEFESSFPIMISQRTSSFANNAVSMAADIIRESSFMQLLIDIKSMRYEK